MNLTRNLVVAMLVGLVLTVPLEFLVFDREHLHAPMPYADVPAFWAVFGFLWCVVIVLASKWLGHGFLMRHRDPYTGEAVDEGADGRPHE